jgi:cytidine deaminase
MEFLSHMGLALDEARKAAARGEVPVGAVILGPDGAVLARDGNRVLELTDPSGHAEVLVIRQACKTLQNERLTGCSMYVTLEPCAMCAGLIAQARIARLYYGAFDPKSGGVMHGARVLSQAQSHHRPEIYDGICESEAAQLLRDFFAQRRGH